ncbi:hypothetical protein, partial [Bradyrhizobium japonicum]|uniref:hypothetical protein n=1 Tax=Bradyrhizobium japonicum TaxID=375 RepID=UPI001AEC2213
DERRELSQADCPRAKAWSRAATGARDTKNARLIDAPRQSKQTKLLRATIIAAIIIAPRH